MGLVAVTLLLLYLYLLYCGYGQKCVYSVCVCDVLIC